MANDRSLPTRTRILQAALVRFSRDGWGGTSIRELATDVGIRESSIYKHFPSKRAIFEALLARAEKLIQEVAQEANVSVTSPSQATLDYEGITEDDLLSVATTFFDAMVGDTELAQMRRLFTVNQFRDAAIGELFRGYWITAPLSFQSELFRALQSLESFATTDPEATALAFFGPIYMLLQLADGGEDAERHARELLELHIRHFLTTHVPTL